MTGKPVVRARPIRFAYPTGQLERHFVSGDPTTPLCSRTGPRPCSANRVRWPAICTDHECSHDTLLKRETLPRSGRPRNMRPDGGAVVTLPRGRGSGLCMREQQRSTAMLLR
jgi:hypothetical protein